MGIKSAVKKGLSKTGKAAKSASKATANAATKAGKAAKPIGAKAGKAVASTGEGTFSVVKETANRVVGLPEAALNAAGVLPPKKVRLRVVVLAEATGQPVVGPLDGKSTKDRVMEAVEVARAIFQEEANVRIVSAGGTLVTVDTTPAPTDALTVRCEGGALKDDLGQAGFFFRNRMARNVVGTAIGAGSPITVFVVKSVVGKHGCSLGPLTDYVTVDVDGVTTPSKRTLAHELGHALGLPHTGGAGGVLSGSSPNNLMQPSNHGAKLNKRQVIAIRNSRHVTFV
jgi:hypothetical protein